MALTLEQLKAFAGVVEKGSFSKAGQLQGKHASTLSQLVSNLEIDLGVELFVRHARSLEMTEAGKELYQYALAVLQEASFFSTKAESIQQGLPSLLTVAIEDTALQPDVTGALAHVQSAFPALDLRLLSGDALQIDEWIKAATADVGLRIGTLLYPKQFAMTRAFYFNCIHVIASKVPNAQQVVAQSSLRQSRQIMLDLFPKLDMQEADKVSHRVLLVSTLQQAMAMVRAGLGWATMPLSTCQSLIESGELLEFTIPLEGELRWHVDVIWLEDRVISPPMQLLLELLQELPDR